MALVEAIQSNWPFGKRRDRRCPLQIERDLEDEFAFHLEMKARDLVHEGHTPETAGDLARASFGNVEHIKRQCIRIAMEDQIMLQRIHVAITVLLALALGITIWLAVNQVKRERQIAMQSQALAQAARATTEQVQAQAAQIHVLEQTARARAEQAHEQATRPQVLEQTARVTAEQMHAQTQAMQGFLKAVLTAAKPHAGDSPDAMRQILDDAARQIDREFASDPNVAAGLRQAIEEARRSLNGDANGVD